MFWMIYMESNVSNSLIIITLTLISCLSLSEWNIEGYNECLKHVKIIILLLILRLIIGQLVVIN